MLTRSPLDSGRRCKRGARNSERVPSVGAKSYRTPKTARQPLGAHAGTASGDICVTRCASVADSFPACINTTICWHREQNLAQCPYRPHMPGHNLQHRSVGGMCRLYSLQLLPKWAGRPAEHANLEGICAQLFTIDGVLARRVVVKLQGSDGHPVCAHALDLPGAKRNVYGPGCV